jgi:hypothetical protein
MPHSKRLILIIFAIILAVSGAWAPGVVAQEQPANGPAVVHHGNIDIIFENASMRGLPTARYEAFDQFVLEHPEIGKALARNPRLIANESFLNSHPALRDFLRIHPDLASDFAENPGNYVDMPVAVAESIKNNPIELQ